MGLTLLPWIICTAWKIIYNFGPIYYGLEPASSITACLAAVGTVTLSALGACFSTLAAVPAQLMRPKAPPMGRRILLERITPLWRRLSFNYKITLRNLFRYQKRFWMHSSRYRRLRGAHCHCLRPAGFHHVHHGAAVQ